MPLENPHLIMRSEDLHHSPPPVNVPTWSENSLYEGYDPEQEIFFYHHMGRVPEDPRYWCGDFNLCLRDGTILASKTFGFTETNSSISTNSLTFDCIEPNAVKLRSGYRILISRVGVGVELSGAVSVL
jgi:hypothetical protein